MKVKATLLTCITAIATLGSVSPAKADTARAFCEYYPNGRRSAEVSMPCWFSQRQGYITIRWQDGVLNDFTPVRDQVGVFTDQLGGTVYRQAGGGKADLIFQMEKGAIYVYWQ